MTILTAGNGNDTYLFGYGSGQDTVYDYDTNPGNLDTVQLGAGIATTECDHQPGCQQPVYQD